MAITRTAMLCEARTLRSKRVPERLRVSTNQLDTERCIQRDAHSLDCSNYTWPTQDSPHVQDGSMAPNDRQDS